MLNQNFVIVGALIYFFGSIGYVIDTLKGKVKPNKVTWFIWTLAPFIAYLAEIKQGVGIQSLFTFLLFFIPLIIFVASFVNKKSYWKLEKMDIFCGGLSVIGLILWQITKIGNIAIMFSILADALAAFPTIKKSYFHPETENWVIYFTCGISALTTVLTIKSWTFEEYAFPLYIVFLTTIFVILIKFRLVERIK